jgi:hypothetical protein
MQTRQISLLSAILMLPMLAACLGDGTLDEPADCDATGSQLIDTHCLGCHTKARVGGERGGAPEGLDFDTEADVLRHRDAIREAAIERQSMPPGRPFSTCERETLAAHLRTLDGGECAPSCGGKVCGDDGCGGVCGTCGVAESCDGGRCRERELSYEADVVPIWRAHGCASAGCHGVTASEGLDLRTAGSGYAGLVDRDSRQCKDMELVDPGDPEGSYLMNKLLGVGMCSGTRMPRGGKLSAEQLSVVRAWIEAGAEP